MNYQMEIKNRPNNKQATGRKDCCMGMVCVRASETAFLPCGSYDRIIRKTNFQPSVSLLEVKCRGEEILTFLEATDHSSTTTLMPGSLLSAANVAHEVIVANGLLKRLEKWRVGGVCVLMDSFITVPYMERVNSPGVSSRLFRKLPHRSRGVLRRGKDGFNKGHV